jgi:hypothetical protein
MEKISLTALSHRHLQAAREESSGRSAHTVYGGHEHVLRQTLIALAAGRGLDEHENPGEATVQVLLGRVRLTSVDASWEGSPVTTWSSQAPGRAGGDRGLRRAPHRGQDHLVGSCQSATQWGTQRRTRRRRPDVPHR